MRRTAALLFLPLCLLVTACEAPSEAEPAEEPAQAGEATSPSPSSSPSPSPSGEPEPEGVLIPAGININCSTRGSGRTRVLAWEEVWRPVPHVRIGTCEVINPPRANKLEEEAAKVAEYSGTQDYSDLYLFCLRDLSEHEITTEAHAREALGAFLICPEHPDAETLSETAQNHLDDPPPLPLGNGTYRVGEDIEAGTYVTESGDRPFSNCYWERTDADGGTIDNHFSASATRVEVTIQASDHTFTSQGCGIWEKQ